MGTPSRKDIERVGAAIVTGGLSEQVRAPQTAAEVVETQMAPGQLATNVPSGVGRIMQEQQAQAQAEQRQIAQADLDTRRRASRGRMATILTGGKGTGSQALTSLRRTLLGM